MARPVLSLNITPGTALLASQFAAWGSSIGDFKEPLQAAVENVAAPAIATNFDVGGRPAWAPLQPQTIQRRLSSGPVLIDTGLLRSIAISPSIWTVTDDRAFIPAGALGDAIYGVFHQTGTSRMPQRQWALLTASESAQIEELFGGWTAITAVRAGVVGRAVGALGRVFGRRR